MDAPVVNYVLIPFKGCINLGYPQGIKLYLQATKDIYKEYDKLDISISNAKGIIDHFLSLANKYGRVSLASMVESSADKKNILRQVEQIQISYIHHQFHGYVWLLDIGNVVKNVLLEPLVVSALQNLDGSAQ